MDKKTKIKRRYEDRLNVRLLEREDFLIKKLGEEWDLIQKTAKREELIRRSKEIASVTARMILALAATGGILFVALVAPNIFSAFGRSSFRRGYFQKKNFSQGLHYLKGQGHIVVSPVSPDKFKIGITASGKISILNAAFNKLKINKTKKWDEVWRIVAFDIPNAHKWSRDGFRKKLKELGLYQLQESVFVTPYPCEEEIQFVSSVYNVTSYVRFITTNNISNDSDLREIFSV